MKFYSNGELVAQSNLKRYAGEYRMIRGNLDSIVGSRITGWALDTSAPNRSIKLSLEVNGRHKQFIVANTFRADVYARWETANHGFYVNIHRYLSRGSNTFEIRALGDDFNFGGERNIVSSDADHELAFWLQSDPTVKDVVNDMRSIVTAHTPVISEIGRKQLADACLNVKFVFILFTNRSGSNLITDMLDTMGLGGGITNEPFLVATVADVVNKHGLKSYDHYLASTITEWKQSGVFFAKLGWDSFYFLLSEGMMDTYFKGATFIFMRRRDKILQAISYVKALRSGIFFQMEEQNYQPPLSAEEKKSFIKEISDQVEYIQIADSYLEYALLMREVDYLEIYYEDMILDFDGTYDKLAKYLKRETGIDLRPAPYVPRLRRQASGDEQELKAQFQRTFQCSDD